MAKNIQRPQLRFKDKIDNSNTPFIPVIKRKPNALRPLEMGKYEKKPMWRYTVTDFEV